VVSHDRALAFSIAHRIAVLEEGLLIAIGTPDEIKRNSDPRVQEFLIASMASIRTSPACSPPQRMLSAIQSPTANP
jgi:ABC-type transporter Mla maintaining outer membrane lipid asymmetry ATPase subunit MlaF